MADDLDMSNRDPNDLNSHVKVSFEDVIGEPDGAHSHDCVWGCSYKCFEGGRKICYLILTFLCAVPLSLCWGCEFACISFTHIWKVTPCLRVMQINLGCAQKFLSAMINCCLAPICETCGLMFSKIKVTNG